MPYAKRKTYTKRRVTTRKPARTTKYTARKTYKSKSHAGVYSTRATVQRGYLPFGSSFYAKLPYSFTLERSTLNTSLANVYQFNLGSVHDPDITGTGHQPFQYDQISAMYTNYRVMGVKYSVTFSDPEYDGCWVGILLRNPEATSASAQALDFIKERRLTSMQSLNNTGAQKRTFSGYCPLHKLYGETKTQWLNNAANKSSVANNPATTPMLEAIVLHPQGTISKIQVVGTLVYYVTFTEPVTVAQS